MLFDPNNTIVQLCAKGMNAEAEGKIEEAGKLFQQAWDIASNDIEAFTAAHYLARNQQNPQDTLKWNLEALTRAQKVQGEEIKGHYPSLYLTVAKSYEVLQQVKKAQQYYTLAADYASFLPEGKYGGMIRSGISAGLHRTGTPITYPGLEQLIDQWCDQKELKALSFILPAYVGNLGTETDRKKILSALAYLSATRCLTKEDQQQVDRLIQTSLDN